MSTTPPPGPVLGPCTSWIVGADVAARSQIDNPDTDLLDTVAVEASMALFEISGRQFTGLCENTVRPCTQVCGCSLATGLGNWYWSSYPGLAWGWWNENGERVGCEPMSVWRLSGYPVRDVTQVLIDGQVVDPGGYRLDGWRNLVRLDDPGPPVVKRYWPGCQNMSLNSDQPGTFEVSYRYGVDPPQLGRDAACQVAYQLYLGLNGRGCKLPTGTTKVARQGITIERGLLANWLDPSKPTGLVVVDTFLAAYWRKRQGRRGAVYSPDVQRFGLRVGS